MLCPSCLTPASLGADFCSRCNAPLSAFAVLDPWKSVFSRGFVYQTAASRPGSRIVLVGMWLLFAPSAALLSTLTFVSFYRAVFSGPIFGVGVLISALLLSGSATLIAILVKTTRNYLRTRVERPDDGEYADDSEEFADDSFDSGRAD